MPLATEKTFHGLKLIARCGGGAYGEVYCCEDISERRMAVKIVSKTRLGDAWKRELRGVVNYRRITENSPNLLQIFHVAEDEDHFYYTMEAADSVSEKEYVPDTLAHRLLSGPLPPDQLFPVLAGICNGIAAIHQAGFAHRDIKPDNILFVGGVPKLADIGLVSSLSNSLTRLAGTLEFLPPEERGGAPPESTDRISRQRNDLYAFGKVVYCAATGLEPGRYPSLPTGMKLSTELKLFMRLAFRLCARESRLRIGDLGGVSRELARIERQLESGETLPDKVRYACGALARKICSGVLTLGGALRKTWWLLVLLVLAAAGIGYRIHSIRQNAATTRGRSEEKPVTPPQTPPETRNSAKPPAPPGSPAPKLKEYAVASLGLKMLIPNRWQAMSEEYIRAQVEEMTRELKETNKDEEAKKMLRYAIEKAKTWKGMIRCDLYDAIEIARQPATAAQTQRMWTLPEADLKREILKEFGDMRPPPEIYEIKRAMFAGRRCVILDLSIDRHDRCREYMFPDDRGLVIVALTADSGTFARRAKEFDEVMKTLEFTTPAPKYAPVKPPEPVKPAEQAKPVAASAPAPREIADPRGRFTLKIPAKWQTLSEDQIKLLLNKQSEIAEQRPPTDLEVHRLHMLSLLVEKRGALIRCGSKTDELDGIVEIVPEFSVRKEELWHRTAAEIRARISSGKTVFPFRKPVIYDVKHTETVGRSTLVIEYSESPGELRSVARMIFADANSTLYVGLTAGKKNFAPLRRELETALGSLKLPPPAPSAASEPAPVQTPKPQSEPPSDSNTRLYVNRHLGFSMQVPIGWELMGSRYVEQLIQNKLRVIQRGGSKLDRWQLETLTTILRQNGAMFRCEADPNFSDCVEIIPYPFDKDSIWHFSDEYIKSQFQLEAVDKSVNVAVYDVRRTKVAGRDCLVVELSNDPRNVRTITYDVYVDDRRKITFAVSARHASFAKRKREFEAAMNTLKFTK